VAPSAGAASTDDSTTAAENALTSRIFASHRDKFRCDEM